LRLDDQRPSTNYQERSGGRGGGGLPLAFITQRFGIGGVIAVALFMLLAPEPLKRTVLSMFGAGYSSTETSSAPTTEEGVFLTRVLGSTEDVWNNLFASGAMSSYGAPAGTDYPEPTLVNFDQAVGTQCGNATSAIGPFYCPADQQIYIDTVFFRELSQRFGAPGDFAQAYVIAHEVGHHVQTYLGINERVAQVRDSAGADGAQVRLELQADCFAGVWGRIAGDQQTAQGLKRLEAGDLEEGLRAAFAIGDDTLQQQARGRVVPDSFTHGTSEQRQRWLRRGFDSGDPAQCDTFRAAQL
jgi:uncharacterized protein